MSRQRIPLLAKISCPHCWQAFRPDELLWVSSHVDLLGDMVLGPEAQMRFSPSRFAPDGSALDPRGVPCRTLACPYCHLIVPRALIEADPLFLSMVGVSGSGKSYLLTAMTWELRRVMPKQFAMAFSDADPLANRALNQYEQTLFLQDNPEQPVRLDKTDTVGQFLYDQVRFGQQVVSLPRPQLFTLRPTGRHPNAGAATDLTRVLCMYDNAGEHFNPGEDTTTFPATRHLAKSRAMLFVFDPLQDPRFRTLCRAKSADPQLELGLTTRRQETVLIEAALRVRHYTGASAIQKSENPLIVVVAKADVWGPLVHLDLSTEPTVPNAVAQGVLDGVDLDRIEAVSEVMRTFLADTAPEFIAAVEDSFANVVYIPVSALGTSPMMRDDAPGLWVRPSQLRPMWVTVPLLYMFARWSHDLIGGVRTPVVAAQQAS